jgi:hypothetical protein
MTLSERIIIITATFVLFSAMAFAATPPDAEMAAAGMAIANAEQAQPRGPAADVLSLSREHYSRAQDAMTRKKFRDALLLADEARALADLALAKARLVSAQSDVDERSARNAEMRRQLLVLPESQP